MLVALPTPIHFTSLSDGMQYIAIALDARDGSEHFIAIDGDGLLRFITLPNVQVNIRHDASAGTWYDPTTVGVDDYGEE